MNQMVRATDISLLWCDSTPFPHGGDRWRVVCGDVLFSGFTAAVGGGYVAATGVEMGQSCVKI